jgi:membrane protein DedA with SNARE-associated domain
MNLGLRTILLLAAVVLFVIAVFSDENYADLLALGLAAFAGAFLSDALGYADRTFNNTRGGNRSDTT